MTYLELVSSYIKKNGGDADLITTVTGYLENAHPHDEPPWCVEFDDICQAAVAYASAKKERPRKHKKANRSRQSEVASPQPPPSAILSPGAPRHSSSVAPAQ